MILVSRFRSSHHCAAHSFANFGIKGTLAIYDSSAVFGFEVPTQARGYNDRNFKSTALGHQTIEQFRIDIAAREDRDSDLALHVDLARQQRGQRDRATRLDDKLELAKGKSDRSRHLL